MFHKFVVFMFLILPLACAVPGVDAPSDLYSEPDPSLLSSQLSAAGVTPERVRRDLLQTLSGQRVFLAAGSATPQPTLDIVALPLYLSRNGSISPITSGTLVSALNQGEKVAVPFKFSYADPATQLSGIITYRLIYDAATTSFVYDTPPFTLVVDQHIDGSLGGTVVSLIADAIDEVLRNNGFLAGVRVDATFSGTGKPAAVTWSTTSGDFGMALTGGYTYTILASAEGWESESRDVWVAPAANIGGVDFSLIPAANTVVGSATLIGQITDLDNAPVSGVRIAAIGNGIEKQAISNDAGVYALAGLEAGNYFMEIAVGDRVQTASPVVVSSDQARHTEWIESNIVFANHRPTAACPAELPVVVGQTITLEPVFADADADQLKVSARVISGPAILQPRSAFTPYAIAEVPDGPDSVVRFTVSDGALDASCDTKLRPVDSLVATRIPEYAYPSLTYNASQVYCMDLFADTAFAPWVVDQTGDSLFAFQETGGELRLDTGFRPAGTTLAKTAVYRRPLISDNPQSFYIAESLQIGLETAGTVMFATGVTANGGMVAARIRMQGGQSWFELAVRTAEGEIVFNRPAVIPLATNLTLYMQYDAAQKRITATLSPVGASLSMGIDLSNDHYEPFFATTFGSAAATLSENSEMVMHVLGISTTLIDKPTTYQSVVTPFNYLRRAYDKTSLGLFGVTYLTDGFLQEITTDLTPIYTDGMSNLSAALVRYANGQLGSIFTDSNISTVAALPDVVSVDLWLPNVFTAQGISRPYLYTGP